MRKLIDLGRCVGVLGESHNTPELRIFAPPSVEYDVYIPPQSVLLYGTPTLVLLRDFLNDAFPPGEDEE